MDLKLARNLTAFFTSNSSRYPYFTGEAMLRRQNNQDTVFEATTTTPAQTAEVLRLFTSGGLFEPSKAVFGTSLRVNFDMIQRVESIGQNRVNRGVNMIFGPDENDRGLIWHHLMGNQFFGPGLRPVIAAFAAAGRDWRKVDFTPCVRNRELRLVK